MPRYGREFDENYLYLREKQLEVLYLMPRDILFKIKKILNSSNL